MMRYATARNEVYRDILDLHHWLKEHDFNYYSINSLPEVEWADFLSSKIKAFGLLYRQFFRLSPINFRILLPPKDLPINPKTTILLAKAYLLLMRSMYSEEFQDAFEILLKRLMHLRSRKAKHFAVKQNKKLYVWLYQADEEQVAPLLTAWAGELFLNAWEALNESAYLDMARSVALYFLEEHPRVRVGKGVYFFYEPSHSFRVYNASAVISSFLVRCGTALKENEMVELGEKGLQYIKSVQNEDGSWFYGEGRMCRYIDNFHLAFVLKSICDAVEYMSTENLEECFMKGMDFYKRVMFLEEKGGSLRPLRYYKAYPPRNSSLFQKADLRDAALAMMLFSQLTDKSLEYGNLASAAFKWARRELKCGPTYCSEITLLWRNRIPYIEFQAWMLLALAYYYEWLTRGPVKCLF